MDHIGFILWSYLGTALLILAVVGYVLWDSRAVGRRLRDLEERGIRRRSAGAGN
jgi:heme exporter protein D